MKKHLAMFLALVMGLSLCAFPALAEDTVTSVSDCVTFTMRGTATPVDVPLETLQDGERVTVDQYMAVERYNFFYASFALSGPGDAWLFIYATTFRKVGATYVKDKTFTLTTSNFVETPGTATIRERIHNGEVTWFACGGELPEVGKGELLAFTLKLEYLDGRGLAQDYYYMIDPDNVKPEDADSQSAQEGTPFSDVDEGTAAWAGRAINWAVGRNIIFGIGEDRFGPGQECTSRQILTMLRRFLGGSHFDDYDRAISWAVEKGIAAAGSVDDTTLCRRSDVATYLWRLAKCPEPPADMECPFTDVSEDDPYYKAVLWVAANGITRGDGAEDCFNPDRVCSRAQIVTFLYRLYQAVEPGEFLV